MSKLDKIEKHYTFSAEELMDLKEIEVATVSFQRAVNGMKVNRESILERAYDRMGIKQESEKEGYERNIRFNLKENKITVTDTLIPHEEKKEEVKPIDGK